MPSLTPGQGDETHVEQGLCSDLWRNIVGAAHLIPEAPDCSGVPSKGWIGRFRHLERGILYSREGSASSNGGYTRVLKGVFTFIREQKRT